MCDTLVVFFNGWGMDDRPFRPLDAEEYDVCMFFDYRTMEIDLNLEAVFTAYKEVILVSWSMGVWVGQKIFGRKKKLFTRTIAINGTLCPVDDNRGIPAKIYDDTLAEFGEKARKKFYRRMCREKTNLRKFLNNQPERSLAGQREELEILRKRSDCVPVGLSVYDEIIIAENDWIVPTRNQLYFWKNMAVVTLPGFHFLFYEWQSWDQLVCPVIRYNESSSG